MASFPLLAKTAAERVLDEGWALDEPSSRSGLTAVPAPLPPPPAPPMTARPRIDDGWSLDTLPPLPAPQPARPLLPSLVAVPRPPVPTPLPRAPRQGSSPPEVSTAAETASAACALPLPPPPESYPGFGDDAENFFAAGDDLTIAAVLAPPVVVAPSRMHRFRAAVRRAIGTIWPLDP